MKDKSKRLWGNITNKGQDNIYTEGLDVEKAALIFADKYENYEYEQHIKDDPRMRDAFTPGRNNLLRWYPFKENCHIIEIGAGMGALTEFLASRAKSVTSIELMEQRASVIKSRCRNLNNVDVVVSNIQNFQSDKRFDYAVVVGVLEYAGGFISGENPHKQFLEYIRKLLKPNGILLLAIENRFGMKYWAGALENHIGLPYVGMYGYEGYTERTFSKRELENLTKDAGFASNRFYYPFPDYKAPTAVFTDEYLPDSLSIANIKFAYSGIMGFNTGNLFEPISQEGLLGFFADAHLIECAVSELPKKCVVGAFMRWDNPEYRCVTSIFNDGVVWKEPYDSRAEQHILDTHNNHLRLTSRGLKMLPSKFDKSKIIMEYCDLPRADIVFAKACKEGNDALIKQMLTLIKQDIEKSSEIHNGILSEWYDLVFYNAFFDGKSLIYIDQEWVYPECQLNVAISYVANEKFGPLNLLSTEQLEEIFRELRIGAYEPKPAYKIKYHSVSVDFSAYYYVNFPNFENCSVRHELQRLTNALKVAEQEISHLRSSTSWKITAPLRRIVDRLRGLK